jgi:long-subunit fatty acid transport protein
MTLGVSRIYYINHYEHLEKAGEITPYGFDDFNYVLHYENTGTGFTAKLGGIYRPTDAVRIGVALHSPTLYRINEYVYDNITSNFTDGENRSYENNPSRYSYALTTPFRALAGVAVQINKFGLISADYEYVDYSTAKFSETGDGYDYSDKNEAIRNSLRAASNLRIGAEMRYNNLYLRGGYGYYGKSFTSNELNKDLDYSTYSGGIGFREQNVFVDFGFTRQINSRKYVLYQSSAGDAISNMSIGRNMFSLTFGYKFGY